MFFAVKAHLCYFIALVDATLVIILFRNFQFLTIAQVTHSFTRSIWHTFLQNVIFHNWFLFFFDSVVKVCMFPWALVLKSPSVHPLYLSTLPSCPMISPLYITHSVDWHFPLSGHALFLAVALVLSFLIQLVQNFS